MFVIEQIARICDLHPTRAKWLIVPSRSLGRTVGDRLTLGGTNWANLRIVTPLDIALRMGAPFLVERGIDPSEEGLGPALVMQLLAEVGDREQGYFTPLAEHPQMSDALWTTFRELRMAGVRAGHLGAAAFVSTVKRDELAALLAAYERYLERTNRGDRASVFEEALHHQDWCPVMSGDCWMTWPDVVWSPLEQRLVDSLPGEHVGLRTPTPFGSPVPRRLASAGSSGDVDSLPVRASVQFFRAGGAEAEVEEVFRRILATGVPLDQVEVVCASEPYVSLLWEKAMRFEWPVTLSRGIPATLTRPGRALLGLAEWVEDDFSAGLLRRLLQSGDVATGDAVSPGRAARLLLKARAAWGRDTYRPALTRLAARERRSGTRDDATPEEQGRAERRAAEVEAVADWIDGLLGTIPVPDRDGLVTVSDVVTAAVAFVAERAATTSALDHLAAARLQAALGDLRLLDNERCTVTHAWRFIRERVLDLVVGADRARPGHLFVSGLRDVGVSGRSQIYVIGLEEGRVFPAPFEDPVLLDDERQLLHPSLRLSSDIVDEAVYAVMVGLSSLLAADGVQLTLSYSCRDVRQFRETYASWVILHVYRRVSGRSDASFNDLNAAMGGPVSIVPAQASTALSEGRWWLNGVTRNQPEAARALVFARYPALRAGAHAIEQRQSDRFTEFDGHVPDAGLVLDPARPSVVVSPTALEGAANCPFRFFVERGLGVRAIDTGERSRDVWLDALVRGSLLHDLYAACLRRCRAERRRVALERDRDWLHEQARRRLAALKAEMPPPSADVEARECAELLKDLDLFLSAEAALDPTREAIGFEISFGHGVKGDDDGEQLASAAPIEIHAGDLTFRVTGRVDRVDRLNGDRDTSFQIVDYKTGSFWKDDYAGVFAGGRLLQHAIYGLAVSELLKRAGQTGRIVGAEYYFSAARGRQHRHHIPAPSVAEVVAVLADIRDVIAEGLFVHAPKNRQCKFCDLKHACGADAHLAADAKAGDPLLAPVRRLAAHG